MYFFTTLRSQICTYVYDCNTNTFTLSRFALYKNNYHKVAMFSQEKYVTRRKADEQWTEISACHHNFVPYDWHGKLGCVSEIMDSVEFKYEEPDNLPQMPLCVDEDPRTPGACCAQEPDNTDTWCIALKCHQKIINGIERCGNIYKDGTDWGNYNLK